MQNFDKLSKNPSKVLKKCIKEALKFNNGQYTPEKLNEINRINFSEEKKSRNGIKVRQKKAVKTHVIVERQRLKTDITQEQQWALLKASFKKL